MKAKLIEIYYHGDKYQSFMFWCPGCVEMSSGDGMNVLPVNTTIRTPSWDFDGDLDAPTLSPSILARVRPNGVCHAFLREGVLEFLSDSTHCFAGQKVPLPELPQWSSSVRKKHV